MEMRVVCNPSCPLVWAKNLKLCPARRFCNASFLANVLEISATRPRQIKSGSKSVSHLFHTKVLIALQGEVTVVSSKSLSYTASVF